MFKKYLSFILLFSVMGIFSHALANTLQEVESKIKQKETEFTTVLKNSGKNPYGATNQILKPLNELISLEKQAQQIRSQKMASLVPDTVEYLDLQVQSKKSEIKLLNYQQEKNAITSSRGLMSGDAYFKLQQQKAQELGVLENKLYKAQDANNRSQVSSTNSTQNTSSQCDALCQQMKEIKKTSTRLEEYINTRKNTSQQNRFPIYKKGNGTVIYDETIYGKNYKNEQ